MTGLPPDPDDQLFMLLQSMGYGPNIPLWQYQQSKHTKPSPDGEKNDESSPRTEAP